MIDKINYLETKTEKFPFVFTLNVMESIQEKYGTIEAWSNLIQRDGEPDIKALKFFITEAINEGLEIEAEKTGKKITPITAKKAGRILTEIGLSGTAGKIMQAISESVEVDEKAKAQGISQRTMREVRSRMKEELDYQMNEKQENTIRLKKIKENG